MDSRTAARIFHDWAFKAGLMDDTSALVKSSATELALVSNVTDKGTQALRQRRIRAVGFDDSCPAVVVFTKRAAPNSKKKLAALPQDVDGIEIRYRQGAPHAIGDAPATPQGAPAYVIRTSASAPRYTCGSSISMGNYRDGGTLCCLVKNAAGDIFGLSNNHVSGGCSHAGIGLPVLAPGIVDVAPGMLDPFTLGHHRSSLPLVSGSPDNVNAKQNLDAAIFKLKDLTLVTSYQRDKYDTPTLTIPMAAGMIVEKTGRTTEHTTGTVIGQMYGAFSIVYQMPLYGFTGPVYFDPLFAIAGQSGAFSDAGDSGSLVTTVDGGGVRKAVGIVVGAMNDGTAPGKKTSLVLPIAPILAGLGVTLVSGHNV